MSRQDEALNCLHKLYRQDAWIQELFQAAGLDDIQAAIDDLAAQNFFDTATWALAVYEKDLGIQAVGSDESRRSVIEAAWKSTGKVDIALLQAVADSWKNGEIEVKFIGGKIRIEFIGDYGVPSDLDRLKAAIDNTKPAHLAVIYAFRYLLIKDIHEVLTINQMQQLKLNQFAGGKDGELYRKTRAI